MDEISADFPYKELLSHPSWPILERAVTELEKNGDFELHTPARYVVGYLLVKLLSETGK